MIILNDVNPPMEEYLEHYGVLGMKWGHRRQAKGKDIRAARRGLRQDSKDIRAQNKIVRSQKVGTAGRAKEQKKLDKLVKEYNRNPDHVIAARMTRGEKVATLILTSPFGSTPALAAIATTSAISRAREQRLDQGKAVV